MSKIVLQVLDPELQWTSATLQPHNFVSGLSCTSLYFTCNMRSLTYFQAMVPYPIHIYEPSKLENFYDLFR